MALDLANNYSRKDGSSASNVYYGYSVNPNASDTDKVFSIRRVTTVAGVESVKWANGNQLSYISDWAGRTYSFTSPSTSLNLSSTTSTSTLNSIVTFRRGTFTWSTIQGVSKYFVTAMDSNGGILNSEGLRLTGQYLNRTWTAELQNTNTWTQNYLNSGTYTVTVRAENVAGFTSSTATINFPN